MVLSICPDFFYHDIMKRIFEFDHGAPPACRLGLATRGNTHLEPKDIRYAVERGVNYLNWCGRPDGLSRVVSEMGADRKNIVLAWQLQSGSEDAAARELDRALRELKTNCIDIVTFYYVESESEWFDIASQDGAYAAMRRAQEQGMVRLLGLTSHQRRMAARIAAGDLGPEFRTDSRPLDMLMLRYNAAHRGAERDVFPTTDPLHIPVVVYTCLRWGALMNPTPDDPSGFVPPPAREWYRFALANPSVAIVLTAPDGREELDHNLALLDDWRSPTSVEHKALIKHGDRVYHHAGSFP